MEIIFCERLKELRAEKNLSQKELSKAIGVSDGTICFWENGTNEPKLTYIKKLANFFEVSSDYLIGIENENGTRTTFEEYEINHNSSSNIKYKRSNKR